MNFKPKVIAVSVLILFSVINLVNVEANKMTTKAEMAELITQVAFYGGWPKAWAAFNYAKEIYTDEK